MKSVCSMLKDLVKLGKLIFVISHDIEFLLNTCGRILYLEEGKISEDFRLTNS